MSKDSEDDAATTGRDCELVKGGRWKLRCESGVTSRVLFLIWIIG